MEPRSLSEAARYAFAPDAERAALLDASIREGLAESMAAIFEALERPADGEAERKLLAAITAGPVRPIVFGLYVDLVMALVNERIDEAEVLLDALLSDPPGVREAWRVVTLDDRDLGPGQADRYVRLVNDDVAFDIAPVPADALPAAKALVKAGLDLLAAGAPGVFAEVQGLIREIVLVSGTVETEGQVLGGATTFSLWGSVLQNMDQRGDRLAMAVSLAHEAGHMHLYGLARGGRLVENEDEERVASPLRRDLRPMDGNVHAIYVIARMVYTLRALLASGRLEPGEAAKARDQLDRYRDAYAASEANIFDHARFNLVGAAALEQARLYMQGAAADAPEAVRATSSA